MDVRVWDVGWAVLAFLSFIFAYISDKYRELAIIFGFILMIIGIVSIQNSKIFEIVLEQRRLDEKLKIHEQLVTIKADICELKKEVFKR